MPYLLIGVVLGPVGGVALGRFSKRFQLGWVGSIISGAIAGWLVGTGFAWFAPSAGSAPLAGMVVTANTNLSEILALAVISLLAGSLLVAIVSRIKRRLSNR